MNPGVKRGKAYEDEIIDTAFGGRRIFLRILRIWTGECSQTYGRKHKIGNYIGFRDNSLMRNWSFRHCARFVQCLFLC